MSPLKPPVQAERLVGESEPRDAGVSQPLAATPELRLLRVFVEVAEQLSFTRAAETLFLRQQTVSKMIRDLERELGVELLERTTRQVHITPAGMMLLQEGRAVLSSADAAFAATRAVGTGENPTIHVGATVAIGATDQAEVARALRQGRPGLPVAFHEVALGNLGGAFTKDRLDVALARTGGTDDVRFDRAELRPTPAVVCLPDTHPLASRREVRAAELDGERLLIPSPVGKPYADMLLAHFRAAGAAVSPVQAHTTGGPVLLIEVAREQIMAVMPAGTVCPSGVVSVPVEDVTLPLLVLWRKGRPPESVDRLCRAMGRA